MTEDQKKDYESPNPLKQIEEILGKKLDENMTSSIVDFNDTPQSVIEDAGKLPTILSHVFLRHYIEDSNQRYLSDFIEEVVKGNHNVRTWRKGRILIPQFSFEELLSSETKDILAPLQVEEEDWQRIIPDREQWEEGVFITGSPAAVKPNLNYKWSAPKNVMDLLFSEYIELEKVTNIIVCCRRWVASVIARQAERKGVLRDFPKMKEFLDNLSRQGKSISSDNLITIKALEKELEIYGINDSEIPGFRGDEQWYAG